MDITKNWTKWKEFPPIGSWKRKLAYRHFIATLTVKLPPSKNICRRNRYIVRLPTTCTALQQSGLSVRCVQSDRYSSFTCRSGEIPACKDFYSQLEEKTVQNWKSFSNFWISVARVETNAIFSINLYTIPLLCVTEYKNSCLKLNDLGPQNIKQSGNHTAAILSPLLWLVTVNKVEILSV